MKEESEFVAYLGEVFRSFGEVRAKRMFGGCGLYHQDVMIGLVFEDTLYFKVDSQSAPEFSKAGSVQFEYTKSRKKMKMSFFSAPEEIFDDEQRAKHWAEMAYGAALRSRNHARTRTS